MLQTVWRGFSFAKHMKTLGIKGDLNEDAIRKAYIQLAKKYHPDSTQIPNKDYAKTLFQEITEARDWLLENKDKKPSHVDQDRQHAENMERKKQQYREHRQKQNAQYQRPWTRDDREEEHEETKRRWHANRSKRAQEEKQQYEDFRRAQQKAYGKDQENSRQPRSNQEATFSPMPLIFMMIGACVLIGAKQLFESMSAQYARSQQASYNAKLAEQIAIAKSKPPPKTISYGITRGVASTTNPDGPKKVVKKQKLPIISWQGQTGPHTQFKAITPDGESPSALFKCLTCNLMVSRNFLEKHVQQNATEIMDLHGFRTAIQNRVRGPRGKAAEKLGIIPAKI